MVRRLIEHQNVHARVDQLREGEPSLLAARKISTVLVNIVTEKKKLREKRTQLTRRGIRWRHTTQLHNDLVAIVQVVELLRVVSNLDFCSPTNLAAEWRNLVQYRSQKCRLA